MMNNVTKVLKWQAGSVKATHRGWTVGPLWQELPAMSAMSAMSI